MRKEEILLLFKNEEYDKAVLEIKKALKEDSDNGELFYYLFLAENKDYSNMDINNILSEVNFNKAIELSNSKTRKKYEAEFKFYKSCDDNFRKLFCYGCRGYVRKAIEIYQNVEGVKIPDIIDDYIKNLNYLIKLWKYKRILKLNLLTLNFLYVLSKEDKLLPSLRDLLKKVKQLDNRFFDYEIVDNPTDMKDKITYYLVDNYKEYFEEDKKKTKLISSNYSDDENFNFEPGEADEEIESPSIDLESVLEDVASDRKKEFLEEKQKSKMKKNRVTEIIIHICIIVANIVLGVIFLTRTIGIELEFGDGAFQFLLVIYIISFVLADCTLLFVQVTNLKDGDYYGEISFRIFGGLLVVSLVILIIRLCFLH